MKKKYENYFIDPLKSQKEITLYMVQERVNFEDYIYLTKYICKYNILNLYIHALIFTRTILKSENKSVSNTYLHPKK